MSEKEQEHLEKMIDLLAKALEGTAEEAVKSYELQTEAGRRKIEKIPLPELFKLRESYIQKLDSLKRGGKLKVKTFKTSF